MKESALPELHELCTLVFEMRFSNSLIIHEAKTKKISSVDDVWKSEEEITKTRLNFNSIFSRNTG